MFDHLLWQSPQSLPAVLGAGVLALLALLWLYQGQLRMLPTPWTWLVPSLRIAAVIVLLAAMLKPVIVRRRNPSESGAVVLLVDRSRSMSVVDSHRSIAQRVSIADALGALPSGTRPEVSLDLRSRAEALGPMVDAIAAARSELEYAQLSGRGTEAADGRLRDAAAAFIGAANGLSSDAAQREQALKQQTGKEQSGRFIAACDEMTALFDSAAKRRGDWVVRLRQRVEAVVNASSEFQNAADVELYRANADVHDAGDAIAAATRLALVERAINDPVAGLISNLPKSTPILAFSAQPTLPAMAFSGTATTEPIADGAESNLNGAIAAVRQKIAGQSVQAVVLYSDGRQVGGSTGAAPVLDVPLFTVGVAGLIRKDIAIARFDVPASAFLGETVNARIEIAATGVKDQPINVTLEADGAEPQTQSPAQHVDINEGRTTVTFPIKAQSPGTLNLHVKVTGTPADVTAANNQSERRIKVLSDKVAVAIIGGSAGWDFQYLRNALLRTPWVNCHDEIVRRDAAPLRMSPQEILSQQVLILDDVDPAALKPDQWDAVGKLVTERGGGAIVIAGDDVSPEKLSQQPVLAELLPWPAAQPPVWQTWEGETAGYRLAPLSASPSVSPSDARLDVTRLSNDPEEDRRRWSQLPPIFRILPLTDLKPNVRPLLSESETAEPVLTEARVGVGRSIFFGVNETWRWRYKIGERDQDRFWLQLVREAGEAPYAFHDQTMALDVDNISPTPNQPVHVRARILDADGLPARGVAPSIRIEANGAQITTVTFRAATPQVDTGRYVVELPGLQRGDYEARLMVGTQATKLTAALHVEPNYEAEMADVSGDDANLRRLAEASGGEFLRLDQIRTLPGKLFAARERRPQTVEYSLWDSPYLYLFILSCLGGEWAMRKQFGLV